MNARRFTAAQQHAVYACINKRCRSYHTEFAAVLPSEARMATGSGVRCHDCGDLARLYRVEPSPCGRAALEGGEK